MLAATRKFAKSWVAAVLIGLLVIAFAVTGMNDVFRGNFSDAVVVAGSRKVSGAEFRREFDSARKNAEQQMGQPITTEFAVENGLDRQVIDAILVREAFAELMSKMGLRASDKLIAAEIQKIPAFFDQITGKFDRKTFEQRLAENNLTPELFDRGLRDEIANNHLGAAMVNGLRVPRAYGALGAVYELEDRDVAYFAIDPRSVPAPAAPTDAQLTQFMNENAARLTRPEFRILTVAYFSPAMVSQNLPIDPAELQKRYEFRRDTISQPETRSLVQIPAKDAAAAQAIAARLTKGEDPAAIAKSLGVEAITYTDKPRTAIADPRVGQAAFALKEGQVSDPIQGALGLAVVKITKVTPGRTASLEDIRPQLEAELRRDAAAEKVYAMTQAYEDAHADGASLADAARKAGVQPVTVGPLTADGRTIQNQPIPGINPKILQAAFALAAGAESDLQELGNGEYFAVKVDRVVPKAMPPLAEVKPMLTQVWMQRETIKRLQARADALAERVKKGETLEAVAASAGAQVVRVPSLSRQTATQTTLLSRDGIMKAFSVKPGEVFTAEHTQPGLIVGKLEGVRAPPTAQLAPIAESARPQMTMGLFREIGDAARAAAKTEVNAKAYPEKARAALGLAPVDEKAPAGKAEKSK